MARGSKMFRLKVGTDNAAFDEGHNELARILREIANDLDNLNRDPWPRVDTIRDINGNIVGEWSLKLKTRRA